MPFGDPSQGPSLATSATQSGALTSWANLSNVTVDNGNYSVATISTTDFTNTIFATGFGFNVPTGQVIFGIQMQLNKFDSLVNGGRDNGVFLTKDGATTVGSDHSFSTPWPTSATQFIYGGATDLWNTTWTPAQTNALTFGLSFAARGFTGGEQLNIAAIYGTVYYALVNVASNGGVTAFQRSLLFPMGLNLFAFDPGGWPAAPAAAGFNDVTDSSTYSWRIEELLTARTPTVSRVLVTYRDLGTVTTVWTLTGTNDQQKVVTNSATVVLGNSSPTLALMTKVIDLTLTAQNLQLSLTRAANAGPLSIAKVVLCGTVEDQRYG